MKNYNLIPHNEISSTLTKVEKKPTSFNGQEFPFSELNDRIFEILLFNIFKSRIENKDYSINDKFDNIYLMQGIGEKGRDCILTFKGQNTGLIQCKKLNKNLTKPEFLEEILKFVLNYINDKELITDVKNFNYYIAVSKGFAETTINLISNFNKKVKNEDIKKICDKLKTKYTSLGNIKFEEKNNEILDVLENIKVTPVNPSDLSRYLFEYNHLIKSFFRVLTVTDNTLLEGIIDSYLAPILEKIIPKKDKKNKDFTFRFREYLERVYLYYSSSRTLIFGNQQKKLEDFYYPLKLECIIEDNKKEILIFNTLKYEDDFLPKFRKILIVDNGGMGKSTIMKWLFLSVIKNKKGIPIFIELRKLKNNKTIIDEIIMELNSLNQIIEQEIVTKLIDQGGFIFFFDGYDEISDDDREFVTTDLQNFISKSSQNLFIMTSRPETALNTFSDFKEFRVKKMETDDAFELIKKIGNNSPKSIRLINKINENSFENINEFLTSPLLVSLLYKKFEHRENIPLQLQEFYFDVFEALFQDHDLTKGESFIRNKKTKLNFNDFFKVIRTLAFYTLKKGEIEYNDSVLNKYLDQVSKKHPNIKFKSDDFIIDIVKNVPLFNKEGLQYKWSHKSFQEYFASEYICRDAKEDQIEILNQMYNSNKIEKYNFIFELCYDIDFKPFRDAVIMPYLEEFIKFCENTFNQYESVIKKNEIETLKSLTFYKNYLIIPESNNKLINKILRKINVEIFKKDKIEDFPEFMEENHQIFLISFSKMILLASRKKTDITQLLVKKKSELIKQILNPKKTYDKYFYFGNDYLALNCKSDLSNFDNNKIKALNDLIIESVYNNKENGFLDYKKCNEYLKNIKLEKENDSKDEFHSGF